MIVYHRSRCHAANCRTISHPPRPHVQDWTTVPFGAFLLDMPRKAAGENTGKPKLKVVPDRPLATSPLDYAEELEREVSAEILERSGREGHENLGPIVKAIVKLAALQFAAARECFEQGLAAGDRQLLSSASTMSGGARMSLVSAHNLAVGQARALKTEDEEEGVGEFYAPKAAANERKGRPA